MSEQRTNADELGVASIETLESLAAEGKFISATQKVPQDWQSADWKFTNNGVELPGVGIVEVFAPGDESGWAVCYVAGEEGKFTGETELIRGNWAIERIGHDRVKWEKDQPVTPKRDGSELSEAPIG